MTVRASAGVAAGQRGVVDMVRASRGAPDIREGF